MHITVLTKRKCEKLLKEPTSKCPFCKYTNMPPMVHYHIKNHLQLAVTHKDFAIVKCNLNCRAKAHFHCCYCSETLIQRGQLLMHIANHSIKSPPNQPGMTVTLQAQMPTILQLQMPATLQPQMPTILQPQMPAALQPQMPATLQPQMPAALQPQISDVLQPQLPTILQPQMTEGCRMTEPQMPTVPQLQSSAALQPQMPAILQPQMPTILQPQISDVLQPQLPTVPQLQSSAALQPGPPNALQPQISDALQLQSPATLQPEKPTTPQPQISDALQPESPTVLQLQSSATLPIHSARKTVTCSQCNLTLLAKNLRVHIARHHNDIEKYFQSQCIDYNIGIFAVQKAFHSQATPIHVIKNTWDPNHHSECELEQCNLNSKFTPNNEILPFECCHVKSLSFCSDVDNPSVTLTDNTLCQLVQHKWFGEARKAQLLLLQQQAKTADTPLSVHVTVGGPSSKYFISVFEPEKSYYSRMGRVMVAFEKKKKSWYCPCAKPRQSCIHKDTAKWHLFQSIPELFKKILSSEEVFNTVGACHD